MSAQEPQGAGSGSAGGGNGLELDSTHYDALIIGTGLTESILAAALASAGKSVLHVDSNAWYGASWASLSLRELLQWVRSGVERSATTGESRYTPTARFSAFEIEQEGGPDSRSPTEPPQALAGIDRHYSISLCPTLLPGAGPTIDILIRSGVASYCTFRMLEHTLVSDTQQTARPSDAQAGPATTTLKRVPSSKEDIFKDRSISLPDKRRLMKVMTEVASSLDAANALGDADLAFASSLTDKHGLSPSLASALAYGVALCASQAESSATALRKMQSHLRSMGKYGPGAYLVGQYGGAGELAQGYCRCAAVNGATYILGHKIRSVEAKSSSSDHSQRWEVDIEGTKVTTDWLVVDMDIAHLLRQDADTSSLSPVEEYDVVLGHMVLNRLFKVPAIAPVGEGAVDDTPKPLPPETALVAFPPEAVSQSAGMASYVLMNGEGTFSTPKGQYIYYIFTNVRRADERSASEILEPIRDHVLALTQEADEEWQPDEASSFASKSAPLPPILEVYHRRRIPSPSVRSQASSKKSHCIQVPYPPVSTPSSRGTSSTAPSSQGVDGLPSLSTLLDDATSLAESLFWEIGGGDEARQRAEALRSRRARRERDEEDFAGRAVALAGVRGAERDGDAQGEGDEEGDGAVWDFFPRRPTPEDAD